jgi:hypothetical protein
VGLLKESFTMDQGLWATWYDLADDSQSSYLDWAHSTYFPYLRQLPGYAWVAHYQYVGGGPQMKRVKETAVGHTDEAVGHGTQYLLLVGAPSAHTFFKPALDEIDPPAGFGDMLGRRQGVRTVIFTEEARVSGPSAGKGFPGSTPGPAIQMGSFRLRSVEDEFEIGRWYAQFRLPYMAQMPGCIATRKLVGVAGWAKHGVLYEFESMEMRLKYFEEPHEALALDPDHWSSRVVKRTIHAPGSPTIATRTWPPVN